MFREVEEGFERDSVAFCFEAGIELFVAFRGFITGIKPADLVEKFPAGFSKFIGKSKTNVAPVGVVGGDVGLGGFELFNYYFDVFESLKGI